MIDGKIAVIPFCWQFYPRDIVEEQIDKSKKLLIDFAPVFIDTVTGYDDIERAAHSLRVADADLVIAMVVTWIEVPDLIDTLKHYFGNPLILWGHTSFEMNGHKHTMGGFVGSCVAKQSLDDLNVPFEFIYGKPTDQGILQKIRLMYRVARTITKLKRTRMGLIGYPALGMYTGTLDHLTAKKVFGPEIVHLDQYQIIDKLETHKRSDIDTCIESLKNSNRFESGITDDDIELSSKMYCALKSLVKEKRLDAVTVKCQYELSQIYKYTPCVALSILGDEIPTGCEGDLQTLLTQVILHYLTNEVVTYVDIHEVMEDRILVGACGFSPFSLSEQKDRYISKWGWDAYSGLFNSSEIKKGRFTLARISRDGSGFKMHLSTGESVGRSEWNEVGCPVYPGTDFVLDGNPEAFAREIVSNHYAMAQGDMREELRLLCRWLGLRYIET